MVEGYWSDGTANVAVMVSLRNEGYASFDDVQPISLACYRGGEAVRDCGGQLRILLRDGFGPVDDRFILRLPMGERYSFEIDGGSGSPETLRLDVDLDVPERILGVDRDLWECFSDRSLPAVSRFGFGLGGCAGWSSETIEKWRQDTPVRVWVNGNGDPRYVKFLDEALAELSEVLNLNFQYVDQRDDASFLAHVGIRREEAESTGFGCVKARGCANWSSEAGETRWGSIVIWLANDEDDLEVRNVITHEAVHALLPIYHAPGLGIMGGNFRITYQDKALFRLHYHPLVEIGMTMPEVKHLLVFSDELLDAAEHRKLVGLEMVWKLINTLQNAGS